MLKIPTSSNLFKDEYIVQKSLLSVIICVVSIYIGLRVHTLYSFVSEKIFKHFL